MPDNNESVLTAERILDAAEDVLRRYGPSKATVVDVARVLGVSHGSVYRHFPSKVALRASVAARWLARVSDPLKAIVNEDSPAVERLRRWLETISSEKRKRAFDDPELFATYVALAGESREVIVEHLKELAEQLTEIVADGVARGEFKIENPAVTGKAILQATARFHDPAHAHIWKEPEIHSDFEAVWELILKGLGVPKAEML